jgi:hypothetical protein
MLTCKHHFLMICIALAFPIARQIHPCPPRCRKRPWDRKDQRDRSRWQAGSFGGFLVVEKPWTSGVLGMFLEGNQIFADDFWYEAADLCVKMATWMGVVKDYITWVLSKNGFFSCNCPGENWAIGSTQEKGFRWFTNSIWLTERLNQQGFLLQLKWDFYHRAGLSNPTWTENLSSVDGILLTFSIAWQDTHCCDLS